MLGFTAGTLYLGVRIVITHQEVFTEVATDDDDLGYGACVYEPDHILSQTASKRQRFQLQDFDGALAPTPTAQSMTIT